MLMPKPFVADKHEIEVYLRTFDWAASPLGPRTRWPSSLRTMLSTCLASEFPIVLFWGPDLVMVYNDAYARILDDKHPAALGRPARDVWPEIWSIVGPMLHGVLETGQATWSYDLLLPIVQNGARTERYFTFSYSPIRDEEGRMCGVFCPVTETTARMQSERRARQLRAEAEAARDQVTHILESMTDHFVTLDRDWHFTYANTTAAQFTHHRVEDLLGKNCWEEFPPLLGTLIETEFRRAMTERIAVEFEAFYAPWQRWVELRVFPLKDGGLSVFFRDITDRKHVEIALRASEARFRRLVESNIIGVIFWNITGTILEANDSFLQMLGYTREEFQTQGLNWRTVTSPVDLPSDDAALAHMQQTGACPLIEKVYLHKNGRPVPVLVTGVFLDGSYLEGVSFVLDLTLRKNAEAERERLFTELQHEHEKLAVILQHISDEVWFCDPEGRISLLNANATHGLASLWRQYSREQLGDRWEELEIFTTDGRRRPRDETPLLQAWQQWESLRNVEEQIRHPKTGEMLYRSVQAAPLHDSEGRFLGAVAAVHDVTEERKAAAAQAQLVAELQRVNAELEQFSYIVSHDLSEPLRTMRTGVQYLEHELSGTLGAETKEEMKFITDAAERMQQMLKDLLAYTRVGGQNGERTPVDCEVLLAQVLDDLQLAVEESHAVVTHDPLPTVQAHASRLKQVWQNLINNALKFHGHAPPHIHIAAHRQGDHWQFAVRDNGIGIDPKQFTRLFQVFQRLHTRSEYPGTGMGLAICKKIIEQHGGRIWVESVPGQGATFFFTIKDKV